MERDFSLSIFTGEKMNGYDFNGVVDTGEYSPEPTDVIITGKYITFAKEINSWLRKHKIYSPIYFMPYIDGTDNILIMALWKSEMIQKLNLDKFYENNATEYEIIKKCCLNCEVIKV